MRKLLKHFWPIAIAALILFTITACSKNSKNSGKDAETETNYGEYGESYSDWQGDYAGSQIIGEREDDPSLLQYKLWKDVALGEYHVIAIDEDGCLWGWGRGDRGQVGDGTDSDRTEEPVKIGNDRDWKTVAAGRDHSMAIKTDGSLWVWGLFDSKNNWADPAEVQSSIPVEVGGNDWKAISGGYSYNTAIKTDGSLWIWGSCDGYGPDNHFNIHTPQPIYGGGEWKTVSAGDYHTVGIKTDGSLWGWGNFYLYDGTHENKDIPTQIGTDTDWEMVSAGDIYTMAIKKDHSLWGWGGNNRSQMGNGATMNEEDYVTPGYDVPTRIGTESNWQAVSASMDGTHTMAIKTDGSLWAWGLNVGNFGIKKDIMISNVPINTETGTNWKTIRTGDGFTAGIRKNGTLWTWGDNFNGQLGRSNEGYSAILPGAVKIPKGK